MAKHSGGGYFGLGRLVSLILAIIPVTSLICGLITAAKNGHWLCFLLRLLVGWNIFWIVDLVCMIVSNKIYILV